MTGNFKIKGMQGTLKKAPDLSKVFILYFIENSIYCSSKPIYLHHPFMQSKIIYIRRVTC